MEWKDYLNDRLIAQHPSGFYAIKPKDRQPQEFYVKIFCDYCDVAMNNQYDEESYKKFGCCDSCANVWVYPNLQRWESGWRPSSEEAKTNRNRFE